LNATAIPGFSKYPGLLVEKNGFSVVKNSQKTGYGFGKTRVENTTGTDLLIYRKSILQHYVVTRY